MTRGRTFESGPFLLDRHRQTAGESHPWSGRGSRAFATGLNWAADPRLRELSSTTPKGRDLTPTSELRRFPASIRRAADFVASTGCHRFGLAPGSTPGLD
jgi:hypothetical protein